MQMKFPEASSTCLCSAMLVADADGIDEGSGLQYSSLICPEGKHTEAKVRSEVGLIKPGLVGLMGKRVMYWTGLGTTRKEKIGFCGAWFCMMHFSIP